MKRRVTAALAIAGGLLAIPAIFVAWPLPAGLLDRAEIASVRITDREGGAMRELLSRKDGRAVPLPRGEIPPRVKAAFIAAEDKRFGKHPGVDPIAIARAVVADVRARRIVSGASTIPAQLARQLVPRRRTLLGKAGEALWALRLCAHLSRERVLREYLDRVPLGHDTWGVESAAELYFGRPASSLSEGQAALLAGLASSPDRFDPWRHPDAARARMRTVLARMKKTGAIDSEELRVAEAAPLDLVPAKRAFESPHLVSYLAGALPALGLDDAVRIETTIDPALQHDVEEAIRSELDGLRDRRVGNAAVLVIDNASGDILAYAGSSDFLDETHEGQNDGVRSHRQPGSALKPFAYALGIARGHTASDLLPDVETHLATATGDYVPKNYDRRVHGPVRLREALANSYNVPAVRLADEIGPDRILAVLQRAGFDTLDGDPQKYGVGIVLGDGDVTLRDLARAYRGLALGGVVAPIREVRAAWDAGQRPIALKREMAPRRFLPADAVAIVTDIISDETARAPAFGLDNALRLPFPVAAKTGTSRAYVDNWCAGFTKERTVAVWVGNFDGTPMQRVSGITGAGPIFKRVMTRAMRGIAPARLVDRSKFERALICPLSGARAGRHCPSTAEEIYLPGTAPKTECPMHREQGGKAVVDVGPEFYEWARGEGIEAGPWPDAASTKPARLLQPADGDEYLLEPGMPAGAQAIPVRALAPAGATRLELRTDDGRVLPLLPPFATTLIATQGAHRLELWLPDGTRPIAVADYKVVGGDPR